MTIYPLTTRTQRQHKQCISYVASLRQFSENTKIAVNITVFFVEFAFIHTHAFHEKEPRRSEHDIYWEIGHDTSCTCLTSGFLVNETYCAHTTLLIV